MAVARGGRCGGGRGSRGASSRGDSKHLSQRLTEHRTLGIIVASKTPRLATVAPGIATKGPPT